MIRSLITVAAMTLTLGVSMGLSARTLEIIEGTYELDLGDIQMPRSRVGVTAFTPCSGCERVFLRVTPRTEYEIDGHTFRLREFLEAVEEIEDEDDDNAMVGVFYNLESNMATRIVVFLTD